MQGMQGLEEEEREGMIRGRGRGMGSRWGKGKGRAGMRSGRERKEAKEVS